MTPKQWRRCAIVAHEQHDRDALELADAVRGADPAGEPARAVPGPEPAR